MITESSASSVAIIDGMREEEGGGCDCRNADVTLQEFGFHVFHEEINIKMGLGLICASL